MAFLSILFLPSFRRSLCLKMGIHRSNFGNKLLKKKILFLCFPHLYQLGFSPLIQRSRQPQISVLTTTSIYLFSLLGLWDGWVRFASCGLGSDLPHVSLILHLTATHRSLLLAGGGRAGRLSLLGHLLRTIVLSLLSDSIGQR